MCVGLKLWWCVLYKSSDGYILSDLIRLILHQVDERRVRMDTPAEDESEDEEDVLLPLSQPTSAAREDPGEERSKNEDFRVATEKISVSELARECVISMSSPPNGPQWLRDEMRTQGALDHLANMGTSQSIHCIMLFSKGSANFPTLLPMYSIHVYKVCLSLV